MVKETLCSSCNIKITNLVGSVKFKCPGCVDSDICRCPHCRKIVSKYVCSKCGFTGPNWKWLKCLLL